MNAEHRADVIRALTDLHVAVGVAVKVTLELVAQDAGPVVGVSEHATLIDALTVILGRIVADLA